MSEKFLLEAKNLSQRFVFGQETVTVFEKINLQVRSGEKVFIFGESGSGKTTLLQILAGLMRPYGGSVLWCGKKISPEMKGIERLRCAFLGCVFQSSLLFPEMTLEENIELPLRIVSADRKERKERVAELLGVLGLANRARHLPKELSGGERQRGALARALANNPQVIIADEPTGNLDEKNGKHVMSLLSSFCEKNNTSILLVTHNRDYEKNADRIFTFQARKLIPLSS